MSVSFLSRLHNVFIFSLQNFSHLSLIPYSLALKRPPRAAPRLLQHPRSSRKAAVGADHWAEE